VRHEISARIFYSRGIYVPVIHSKNYCQLSMGRDSMHCCIVLKRRAGLKYGYCNAVKTLRQAVQHNIPSILPVRPSSSPLSQGGHAHHAPDYDTTSHHHSPQPSQLTLCVAASALACSISSTSVRCTATWGPVALSFQK
jgi:hypothetical protein